MPTIIAYVCPQCKSHLENQDAYHSIGPPFVECGSCNFSFSIEKNRTEWDLKTPTQQLLFKSKIILFSAFLGFGTGGFFTDIVAPHLGAQISMLFSVPCGVALWYWIMGRDMRREISESKERMKDHAYRHFLTDLGLQNGPKS